MVEVSGFRVWDLRYRAQGLGSGFRNQVSRFRVQGSGFKVQACKVPGSGFRVQGSGSMVQNVGCRVYLHTRVPRS